MGNYCVGPGMGCGLFGTIIGEHIGESQGRELLRFELKGFRV